MLSKVYRLKKSSAFTATYRVKKSFYLNGVAVFVGLKKQSEDIPTKVGFVVSKKTHKRATKRNRLKRYMRESYRLLMKENNLGKSSDYMSLIFVGHVKALDLTCTQMKLIIKDLIGLIDD